MKLRRFALIALVLPAALAAQQPQGPPTDPIATSLKGRSATLRRNLAQAFDSIPDSKFSFKPTDKQQTIGYVAQHVASDSYLFCNAFGDMKDSRSDEEKTAPDTVKATWPKEKLVAQLKAAFAFCDQAAGQLNDANISAQVTITQGTTTRQINRANMVVGHALDLQDHYSQIANYMRAIGMLPPTALPRPGRGGE